MEGGFVAIKTHRIINEQETIHMSKEAKKQDPGSQGDVPFKKAFKEFLAHTMGIDKDDIKTTLNEADVVVFKDGKPYKYFELKTSRLDDDKLKKKGYFGAASITEWKLAVDNPDDFYFVFMKGKDPDYEYMMVKAKDLYSYATVPPFAIDIKIKVKEHIEKNQFKKLSEEITCIDDQVTHIEPKKRRKNRKSLGVDESVIRDLDAYFKKLRESYLAQLDEGRK